MGLREDKKLATRRALSWAAMHLAVERGLDNVRVEDIAAMAGVSPRTYNNYFANKEEAMCGMVADRATAITAHLRDHPDEPLATALTNAMAAQYETNAEVDRDWVARSQAVMSAPALRGEFLKAVTAIEDSLTAAIAERLHSKPNDLYPAVLAATVTGASRAAVQHWQHTQNTPLANLADVVRTAITQALNGLPTQHGGEAP